MFKRYSPTDSFIRSSCALLNALYLALQYTLDTQGDEVLLKAQEAKTNVKRMKNTQELKPQQNDWKTIGDQCAHLPFHKFIIFKLKKYRVRLGISFSKFWNRSNYDTTSIFKWANGG